MHRVWLSAIFLIVVGPAVAGTWESTADKQLTFEVLFEGEPLPGDFRKFDVTMNFDSAAPEASTLKVSVDLTAADMGDPDMNAVLFDPAWFDVGQFAEATFSSGKIAGDPENGYTASGTLDLKGIQQPVTVPFSWTQSGDKATMQGTFAIRRTDFNVGDGEWANDDSIGLDVQLTFSVQLEARD